MSLGFRRRESSFVRSFSDGGLTEPLNQKEC